MKGFQSGQCVLITGAGSGIGAATARRFATEGARLVLLDVDLDAVQALADVIGGSAVAGQLDVRDAGAVERVLAQHPVPDVLVNNAGLSKGVEKTDDVIVDNFDRVIDVNVKGLFYVTRAVMKGMRARNSGHIVNIGSVGWMCPFPGGNSYIASKAAVHSFTHAFRSDTQGTKIRVSEILPGMVKTNFSNVRFDNDEEKFDAAYRGMEPLMAEDIADAIFYCVNVPPHVNIESLAIYPQSQTLGGAVVTRDQ